MATLELIKAVEDWLEILDHSSYYELLGVLEIADPISIKRAFHQFSGKFHPDCYRGEPAELVLAITKIYQRGAEAYGVLRDDVTRAKYDLTLNQGELRYPPGQTAPQLRHSSAAPALVVLAQSKAAQLHARQAERALAEGKLEEARVLIQKAVAADGSNPELEQRAVLLAELVRSGTILTP